MGKDSAFVGSFGNSKVLTTESNECETHEDRWSDLTTLQQGELSILIIDECGPQLPVTDFRYLHELHEFTSAASHIGSAFLHGICLRNTFDYDNDTNDFRILHYIDRDADTKKLDIHENTDGYCYYDYENDLWMPDRPYRNGGRRAMIPITSTMITTRGECREGCQSCIPTYPRSPSLRVRRPYRKGWIPYGRAVCNQSLKDLQRKTRCLRGRNIGASDGHVTS